MEHPQIMPEEIAKIYWAKLLKVSRSIRQKHLVFDKSEKKGRIYQPYEKRCWQRDKSLYLHILEWTAESMEIRRMLENINQNAPISLMQYAARDRQNTAVGRLGRSFREVTRHLHKRLEFVSCG